MIRVGLTGGYATGKSFVAAELSRLGCFLIYADKLGHQVLEPDGEAYREVVDSFGKEILDAGGRIDRSALAGRVFGDATKLTKLTRIVHPAVFRLEERELQAFVARQPDGIAVIEAAILIETGRYKIFDRLILANCSEDLQIERGMKRDGLSTEQVRDRLKEQMPFSEKQSFAHYIVDTGGDPARTLQQVQTIYAELETLARSRA